MFETLEQIGLHIAKKHENSKKLGNETENHYSWAIEGPGQIFIKTIDNDNNLLELCLNTLQYFQTKTKVIFSENPY